MTDGSDQPPGRVADYLRRREDGPTATADQPAPLLWWVRRLSIAAALAIVAYVIGLFVLGWYACTCSPTPALPASPAAGVVVGVDSAGLGQVSDFTLRVRGYPYVFRVGALENVTEFPPSHLVEHLASSQPVRVYYRLDGSVPVVYRLEDASARPT